MAVPPEEEMLADEEQLLMVDPEVAPRRARRPRTALKLAGLALAVLAVCGVFAFRSRSGALEAGVDEIEDLDEEDGEPDRPPLVLEDLGRYVETDVDVSPDHPFGGYFNQRGSFAAVGAYIFKRFQENSGIGKELTPDELEAFKYRFIAAMLGMESSNKGKEQDFIKRVRERLQGTKPVFNQALADWSNKKNKNFKVKMQKWLIDESVDSFNKRLIKVDFTPERSDKVYNRSLPEYLLGASAGTKLEAGLGASPGLRYSFDSYGNDGVPDSFDPRAQWPHCAEVFGRVFNQGECGACWAFSALGALDSRLCILTEGKYSGENAKLSRGFAASCAVTWDGCQGGWPHNVYDFVSKGGGLPSTNCIPYFAGGDYENHWNSDVPAPACPNQCSASFPQPLMQDLFRPIGVGAYKTVNQPNAEGIKAMKLAMMEGGPVPWAIAADGLFMGYYEGVYDNTCGQRPNHAVQAIGWGVERLWNGRQKDYILGVNSWGEDWGQKGLFKVAPCMVYMYTVPGPILNRAYPLPIPSLTPPTGQESDQDSSRRRYRRRH